METLSYTYDSMERPLATYVSRDGGPERLLCGTGYDALGRVASVQPYKYTGKELDRETGLDWYDSQARMLDPTTGRTTTMDPLAEKYYPMSPYLWCGGNPIRHIDKDGRHWVEDKDGSVVWLPDAISAETTPKGCEYLGESYNGISIINYSPHKGIGDNKKFAQGLIIQISAQAESDNENFENCIQTITDCEVNDEKEYYLDGDKENGTYFTAKEAKDMSLSYGPDGMFSDVPERTIMTNTKSREAELTFVFSDKNGNLSPKLSLSYGFIVDRQSEYPSLKRIQMISMPFVHNHVLDKLVRQR